MQDSIRVDLASQPCSPAPEAPLACWSTAAGGGSGRPIRLLRLLAFVFALEALVTRPAPAANPATAPDSGGATSRDRDGVVGERPRIAVLRFFGPRANIVRAAVIQALVDAGRVELPPISALEAQLGAGGSFWAQAAEVARRWGLDAIVHGATRKSGRVYYATVTVLAGDDGTDLGHLTFSARSLPRLHAKLQAEMWPRLRPLLDHARAPTREAALAAAIPRPTAARPAPPPAIDHAGTGMSGDHEDAAASDGGEQDGETKPGAGDKEEPPQERRQEEPARPPATAAAPGRLSRREQGMAPRPATEHCALMELEVGAGVLTRSFNYRGEQRGALRGYVLRRAPMGRMEGTLYPFARYCGLAGAFGLRASYERMASVVSRLADRELTTTSSAYRAELVGRIALGRWVLTPALGYYVRSYGVEEDVVPRVKHQAWGGSLDAQVRLRSVVLEMSAGARRVIDAGALQSADWFPGLTGMTYSGRLRVGGAMTDWLDVILGAYAEYSTFDFHIQESGLYRNGVAAGAHDAYLTILLSLRLHWP